MRVIAPDVGGGFGSKIDVYAEEFALAQASRLTGRPVKWIETRSESMVSTVHGRDQLQTATLAADRDGRMLALRVHLLQDCGAYLELLTPSIAHLTVIMVPGAYDLEHVDIKLDEVFTNTTPTDAYRGAGRPEAAHLVERLVDRLADELGLDPAELRRLNFADRVPVHDGHRASRTTPATTPRRSTRRSRCPTTRASRRAGRGRGARQLPRHRALDLGRDLRPRAVGRDEGDRHRRGRLGVVDRAPAPDRVGDRSSPAPRRTGRATRRPGRRSSRASSASRSTRSRSCTATPGSRPTASARTARARWPWAARRCT